MSQISILTELLLVLAVTLGIVFLFHKLRLPTIVGFLLAGVFLGPDGLGLIRNASQVETLAGIGVVFLLFTIGLEFSLGQLAQTGRTVLWAGIFQILITIVVVLLVSLFLGYGIEISIFYGFLVSLSSTAIVLRIYNDRGEIDALQGRLATGILLLQDLCIVPMMLLVPVLGQSGKISFPLIGWAFLKAFLALLIIVSATRTVFPWLLRQVTLLRNRELFVLFIVFICLGMAWLTSEAGLSLALGAFIAGLVISESEFSHQIIADILPLRDCFSGIFFISIGMLLNLDFLMHNVFSALLNLILIVGIKGVVIFVIFWWFYRSLRLGVVLGLSLAQVGEFSLILAKAGAGYGLLTATSEQTFLSASILSMIVTPFLIQWAQRLAFGIEAVVRAPSGELSSEKKEGGVTTGHVIVVGYGLNGQNLSRVLKEVGIPYRILEMDPDLVNEARAADEPITFGDGTRPGVLQKMGIEKARILVLAISDPVATSHVVSQVRRLRHDLYIIVRTRYVAEIDRLYTLGANQVIPEEFETSVEIFARVLQEYHLPRNVISLQVDLIRKEHYGTLRGLRLQGKRLDELTQFLVGTTTDTLLILEGSPAVGQTLAGLEVRQKSGVTVIAVVRDGQSFHNPAPDFRLASGDILVLLGSHKELDEAMWLFSPLAEKNGG
ncbi:MAG: cation:proton antiporter [Deltaproteobacteria bacterium]|nr:cation:proton antiporter [Deltaproteobacteria bacterium]